MFVLLARGLLFQHFSYKKFPLAVIACMHGYSNVLYLTLDYAYPAIQTL
jgi:hypothetical protein